MHMYALLDRYVNIHMHTRKNDIIIRSAAASGSHVYKLMDRYVYTHMRTRKSDIIAPVKKAQLPPVDRTCTHNTGSMRTRKNDIIVPVKCNCHQSIIC